MSEEYGNVKNFNRLKGYGFINPDEGEEPLFVHYSALQGEGYRNIYEGDRVSFERVDAERGPQAQNVRIILGAPKKQHPE